MLPHRALWRWIDGLAVRSAESASESQPKGEPLKVLSYDSSGNILLPKWFLGFLSAVVGLASISLIPWAIGVSEGLNRVSEELAALSVRLEGQQSTNSEPLRGLHRWIERLEFRLDRLEEWQHTAGRIPSGGFEPMP